jgi:cell division protein FtsA
LGKRDIKVGLDIGSSKVCVIICEQRDDSSLDVVGMGVSPSAGLRRGVIVDIDSAAAAISDAAARAENMSGCALVSAVASVSGAHAATTYSKGIVAVGRPDKEIGQDDVERVLDASRVVAIPPDREVIHVLPREFVIDGCRGIRRPVGMSGIRLEVETCIITGSSTSIQNVRRAAARVGLDIDQLVLQPIAAAEAVLTDSEKNLGALMIDIGGATTDIAFYLDGTLQHTAVIPVGGSHMTNDVALVLRLPVGYAEELKIKYGAARADMVEPEEMCGNDMGVSRYKLCQIIEARVYEIMEMVKAEVDARGFAGQLPAGIVVTGAAALMRGVVEAAQDVLKLPSRLGVPTGVSGMADVVASPAYAAALGLVKYAWGQSAAGPGSGGRRRSGFAANVRDWFREIFSA